MSLVLFVDCETLITRQGVPRGPVYNFLIEIIIYQKAFLPAPSPSRGLNWETHCFNKKVVVSKVCFVKQWLTLGPSINYVITFSGIFDPPPPPSSTIIIHRPPILHHHFSNFDPLSIFIFKVFMINYRDIVVFLENRAKQIRILFCSLIRHKKWIGLHRKDI